MAFASVVWPAALLMFFQSGPAAGPRLSARLLADPPAVAPGGTVDLAIEVTIEPPWHLYHPILLGAGLPTAFEFDVPGGVTIDAVRFPTPYLAEAMGSEFLGYEKRATFLTRLSLAGGFSATGPLPVKVRMSGLACTDKTCVPASAAAELSLAVSASPPATPADARQLFEKARRALPPPLATAPYLQGSALRVSHEKVPVGGSGALLIHLKVQEKHHIQHRDPGAEGLIGTRVFVEAVDGITFDADAERWPAPKVKNVPGLGRINELSGELVVELPFRITDRKFEPGPQRLRVLVQYQCCTDSGQCYPPEMAEAFATFEVVPAGAAAVPASDPETRAALARLESQAVAAPVTTPPPDEQLPVAHELEWRAWERGLPEQLSSSGRIVYVDFTAEWCATCQWNKNTVLRVDPVKSRLLEFGVALLKADFTREDAVIKEELQRFARAGVPLNLIYVPGKPERPIVLPEVLTSALVMDKLAQAKAGIVDGEQTRFFGLGLFGVFLFAFLGGIILNVMPCVLPVLSLKLFSLLQQARDEPERVFQLGLVYGAGILVSFVPLAIVMVIGGLAWGGLMQRAPFVIGMSAVTLAFGLAMLGVWELRLPGIVENTAGAVTTREGYGGSFLNGFMATALATPCVGPFLGPAIGFLIGLPPVVAALGIMTVGVGLAFPMVLLSAFPGWRRFLPKPGNWMIIFKQIMGFILLATVLWLLRTLRYLVTPSELLAVLTLLLGVAMACWALGRITLSDSAGRRTGIWATAVSLIVGSWYTGQYFFPPDPPAEPTPQFAAPTADAARTAARLGS